MDEKFKSSFIPKQPLVGQESGSPRYNRRKRQSSPFVALSTLLFVVSGLIYAGVWGYTFFVEREIDDMEELLESQRQEFKPAEIAEYKRFDDRLKVAASILNNHVAVSEVFVLLSEITLPSVRYTTFDFSKDAIAATEEVVEGEIVRTEATERLKVALGAEAGAFEDIALQAKEFEKSDFIRKSTFSDFALTEAGTISFKIEALIDPRLIGYIAAINRAPQVMIEEMAGEGVSVDEEAAFQSQIDLNDEEM